MAMKADALPWLRWLLALAGVFAAGALIWFAGPLVAIAGSVPLAGEPARWLAIAALAALVSARALWRSAGDARRNRRLMDGLVADAAAPPSGAPGDKEVALVAKRFEKAVTLLRRSRIGGTKRSWLAALAGRPFVYELPWYIIIGAPGAGKTTALVNSGLEFPLAAEIGQPVIRGIGGTRNCDWWFSSQAVLIDTAGRYTTHDSDPVADRAAWFGFLALLARYRPRRPINGALLTLSVSDLLNATPEQRIAHAGVVRERIEELHDQLGIGFPVYVLVTKMDLLAGFMDFFADFDKDERSQVWGATFPYQVDATRDGPQVLLAREFAALEKRLNDCMIAQLQGQSDRERRTAIYTFPQQWRVLRQTLFEFVQQMLGGMRADLRPLVRGVYFTSATQEGSPMDRALGGLARALGLPGQVLPPSRPSGKTFFVTRLLREVVFSESGLAGTNLRWRRRRRGLEWGLAGLCVCAVMVAAVLSWRTYASNRTEIEAMASHLPVLERDVARARLASATDLVALLPALDTLSALAADGPREWSAYTPGLDRGVMLGSAADDSYLRALREAFQPRIAARLEARLRAGEREHVELIYETLKAYLMLYGGRNFDRESLRAYLIADWDATLPVSVGPLQRQALRQHLDRLLASGEVGAPANADPQLIARSRALVASVPLAQRAYARLKQMDLGADAVPFSLESSAGPQAKQLFVRASGQDLASGVPALYSRKVFQQSLQARTQEVLRQFAREQHWVLGSAATAGDGGGVSPALAGEVQGLYLADYASRWQAFLGDLQLTPTPTLASSAEVARLLARPDSPLLSLLRSAVREVSVLPPSDPLGARFEALNKFLSGQPAPIDAIQALLDRLSVHLADVDNAAKHKALPPTSDVEREFAVAVEQAPEPLRGLLLPLATTSASLVFAATREPLSRQVASDIAPQCSRAVAARYPLERSATEEISRDEFVRTFGAGGLLDRFFQRHLLAHVDVSVSPWTFRGADRSARSDSAESLQSFKSAKAIREAFFRDGGRQFGVALELRPLEFDPGIAEFTLDIDGQVLRFRPGSKASQSAVWPQASDNAGRVRVQLTPASGAAGPGFTFQGPWALLRLLDRVRTEPGATPDRSILTFDVEGRKVRFEVRSSGGLGPAARQMLEQFRCPGRL
jgi:type VI secretion system protein ImpL